MKINEKLRRLRIEAGLSQEAFAAISYSSQNYIKQCEKGYVRPDRFVIESIADFFFIDPDIFADENNDVYLPEIGLPKKKVAEPAKQTTKPTTWKIDKRCDTCMYRSSSSGRTDGCLYILITGHMRGCPPGDKCDKYKKGDEVKHWKAIDLTNSGYGF